MACFKYLENFKGEFSILITIPLSLIRGSFTTIKVNILIQAFHHENNNNKENIKRYLKLKFLIITFNIFFME